MWMTPEDSRSDFVLAAATTLFGFVVIELVTALPLYPSSGLVAELLLLFWVFALTGLVPLLLVRYRNQGLGGFGLDDDRASLGPGLLVALPLAVVWFLKALGTFSLTEALLGRLAVGATPDPTVSGGAGSATEAAFELVVAALLVVVLGIGGALLFTFLAMRSREGFRRTEMRLVEGLRTFGMAIVGAAFVLGLLASFGVLANGFVGVLLDVGGLAVMILLTDRLVATTTSTSRATLLAPSIVALVLHVFQFRGNLILGIYAGVLAAGVVLVMTSLVETRRHAWAAVPVAAVAALYPSCLSPLPFFVSGATC